MAHPTNRRVKKRDARTRAKQPDMYLVEWRDAIAGPSGWRDRAEAQTYKPAICYTVGFVLARDRERVVIAHTIGDESDSEVGVAITIPAQWITRMRRLGRL